MKRRSQEPPPPTTKSAKWYTPFYLYKKIKLSIKDYLLLVYTFMCMIIFLRIIILSFRSHQTRILSAGLGMAWIRDGLSCNTIFFTSLKLRNLLKCFLRLYCWFITTDQLQLLANLCLYITFIILQAILQSRN